MHACTVYSYTFIMFDLIIYTSSESSECQHLHHIMIDLQKPLIKWYHHKLSTILSLQDYLLTRYVATIICQHACAGYSHGVELLLLLLL